MNILLKLILKWKIPTTTSQSHHGLSSLTSNIKVHTSDKYPPGHTTNLKISPTPSIQHDNHHNEVLHDGSNVVPSPTSSNPTSTPCSNPTTPLDVSHVSDSDN